MQFLSTISKHVMLPQEGLLSQSLVLGSAACPWHQSMSRDAQGTTALGSPAEISRDSPVWHESQNVKPEEGTQRKNGKTVHVTKAPYWGSLKMPSWCRQFCQHWQLGQAFGLIFFCHLKGWISAWNNIKVDWLQIKGLNKKLNDVSGKIIIGLSQSQDTAQLTQQA